MQCDWCLAVDLWMNFGVRDIHLTPRVGKLGKKYVSKQVYLVLRVAVHEC